MKIKMKTSLIGAIGNGEATMEYKLGESYDMKTNVEMEMATAWCNDGRAEKATETKEKKVVEEVDKKSESKVKKVAKKIFVKKINRRLNDL